MTVPSAANSLHVESSTGVEVMLPIAGPGARAYAFVLDWHIRTILACAWLIIGTFSYSGNLRNFGFLLEADTVWLTYILLPALAIYLLYHPVLEIGMRGRTPGKRLAGVRLGTYGGGAPTFGACLIRNVFRLIDNFPVFYGLGLLLTMITRKHVRVGDLAAGTVLVYEHLPQAAETLPAWRAVAARTRRLARRRRINDIAQASAAVADYHSLAHDVARARERSEHSATRPFLETLYAQLHAALHRPAVHRGYAILFFFRNEVPQAVNELRLHILWVTLLFLAALFSGGWLVQSYPNLIELIASPALIATVERGELWTDSLLNIVPSSILSLQILTNNIIVSLFAFCAGFLFGLGTFYIVGLNGFTLGGIFAFTAQYGLDDELFRFVVAHGCVELSVMCLSGAAGAALGEALIRPDKTGRSAAFQQAAARAAKLLTVCLLLLIGCGFIEGYISPDLDIPLSSRVLIGTGYWLFMLAVLRGWLFGRSSDAAGTT
jgi:uncharacterized membrane protein SpoIIM required for sporulation/uncharacterized RDD family membrane protein YckC